MIRIERYKNGNEYHILLYNDKVMKRELSVLCNKDHYYLTNFRSNEMKKGYGRILLRYTIGLLRDKPIKLYAKPIGKETIELNALEKFYKSEGFVSIERYSDFIKMIRK